MNGGPSAAAAQLVVLRGNSCSGKTTVARALQRSQPGGAVARVSQDVVRREVLGVRDTAGNPSVELIDVMVRHTLARGTSVVLEGILHAPIYGPMLRGLLGAHDGLTRCYFWDLPFDETVRRHTTKPDADFGSSELARWWYGRSLVEGLQEQLIDSGQSVDDAVARILADCGWNAVEPA